MTTYVARGILDAYLSINSLKYILHIRLESPAHLSSISFTRVQMAVFVICDVGECFVQGTFLNSIH